MDKNELLSALNEAHKTQYIAKPTRTQITKDLEFVKQYATKKEVKVIDEMIGLVSTSMTNKKVRNDIVELKRTIMDIVDKYEEEYNGKSNEDYIDENLSNEEIQSELDNKIPIYCGFDKDHPMNGVSYIKSSQKYLVRYDDLNTTIKNVNTACDKIKEKMEYGNFKIFDNYDMQHFVYLKLYFISYWIDGKSYFDIQHAISVLNLKTTSWNNKYNEFKSQISHYIWHQNEFGGYILRELINNTTLFELVMSSNAPIARHFKRDVAEILSHFIETNQIKITKDKVVSKKPKGIKDMDTERDNTLDKEDIHICSYDSPQDMEYVMNLIDKNPAISCDKYAGKHVLYAFIIPLRSKHRYIIIKFGYTEDLAGRFKSLKKEYNSKVYFVKAKLITGEADERRFHKHFRMTKPTLIEKYQTDSTEKVELYKLSPLIIDYFNSFMEGTSIVQQPLFNPNDYFDNYLKTHKMEIYDQDDEILKKQERMLNIKLKKEQIKYYQAKRNNISNTKQSSDSESESDNEYVKIIPSRKGKGNIIKL